MRAIFTLVLLIASTGMIYAGVAADAPVPGIDYDIKTAVEDSCRPEADHGDRLLSFVSGGGDAAASSDVPDQSLGKLFHVLSCGWLDGR